MNKNCLVGYTGYVGSTLLTQTEFDDVYNSSNIRDIKGKAYDLVICAAAPAVKWKANQAPEEDLSNINSLITCLKEVEANRFVLISTVDVYSEPVGVNEETPIEEEKAEPYGRHRYFLEQFVASNFEKHLIIRLPGLFGRGLKKNFIYDLVHNNALHLTHHKSQFQFYNMSNLWKDIQTALSNHLTLVNFATEPVCAEEIADYALQLKFTNVTEKKPVFYDMKSKYASIFSKETSSSSSYIKTKKEVLKEIADFIKEEKGLLS